MPPHNFSVNLFDHVIDGELTPLFSDPRKEGDLEKQIAKLLAQRIRPALARFFQSIEGFVSFLKQHRRQSRVSLLAIPRTAARRAESIHQLDEIGESLRHAS